MAGADIKEFKDFGTKKGLNLSQIGKQKLFNKIAFFNKPVIAAINGYALGGVLSWPFQHTLELQQKTHN